MKTTLFAVTLAALAAPLVAQERFQQEALLIYDDAKFERVWILSAGKNAIRYVDQERSVSPKQKRISEMEAIWLMEPAEYTEAMELYQGRNYEEARGKFAAVRARCEPLQSLPDNHSSLAALYEMECLRKLNRLDDLEKAQETFLPVDRESLTRDHHKSQLELYSMWDAVRTKEWPRLELICVDKLGQEMPGYQRAQVGYCLGLALEGQDKSIPAINAYNIAMTADTGASEILTRKSALNALRLYAADDGVKLAIELHGTPDENPQSSGAARLAEAASLASLYELTLGGDNPLPTEYQEFLKYLAETPDAPAPEEKEEAKEDE
jgi:hypothetical protein